MKGLEIIRYYWYKKRERENMKIKTSGTWVQKGG
jgi:hypothetical protein